MAHELDIMADGTYSMARAANTDQSWHGLENIIPDGADFDTWFDRSGMNFTINRAPVEYQTQWGATHRMDSKHVLYRSDNLRPLSVVSDNYNIVQPRQVLEFFRELCSQNGLTMDTAGVIRGGVKFWAMARTGEQLSIGSNDIVKQYVLLATSADYSMATTAKHTNMRVVCSNTFHANVNNGEAAVKVRHSREFDANAVKLDLGLMNAEFQAMGHYANEMAKVQLSKLTAARWFAELLEERNMNEEEFNDYVSNNRVFKQFWEGYRRGPGASETLWGAFNGITYVVDHIRGRSTDTRMNSAWFGAGSTLKERAWQKALAVINDAQYKVAA